MCEWLPVVVVIGMQVHWVLALPGFYFVLLRVRRCPANANRVYRFSSTHINDHPLLVGVLRIACDMCIQIWVAFPKRFFINVGNLLVTVIVILVVCCSVIC